MAAQSWHLRSRIGGLLVGRAGACCCRLSHYLLCYRFMLWLVLYGDDGSLPEIVANICGISEATSAACVRQLNEAIISTAVARAASFRHTPYFLIGDVNCNIGALPRAGTAMACAVLFDVCADHWVTGPTFSNAKGGRRPLPIRWARHISHRCRLRQCGRSSFSGQGMDRLGRVQEF